MTGSQLSKKNQNKVSNQQGHETYDSCTTLAVVNKQLWPSVLAMAAWPTLAWLEIKQAVKPLNFQTLINF